MREEIRKLGEVKTSKKLSYEMIAKEIGVSFNTVHRWLKDKNEPSQMALGNIREYLSKQ